MRIIITESQYKNLFESKEEKKSDLLYSMWMEGMSMDDIKDYTGLNMQQIISYLKNKEINIDCKFAEKLVLNLIHNTDFINKNYNSPPHQWGFLFNQIFILYENYHYGKSTEIN